MWMVQPGNDYGALNLTSNTSGRTEIANNHIYGNQNYYAVYFFRWNGLTPTGNAVTNNDLWSGLSSYLGGNFYRLEHNEHGFANTLH
jgi:hypothetical protein